MVRSTHDGQMWGAIHGENGHLDHHNWGDGYESVLASGWGDGHGDGYGTGYWHGNNVTGAGQGLGFDER